jgi:hypothetical protein
VFADGEVWVEGEGGKQTFEETRDG